MSYRAFKRLLGETSLERKCRFLFGAGIFFLLTLSFWFYAYQNERLAYDQAVTSCRLLVFPILAQQHLPYLRSKKEPEVDGTELMKWKWLKAPGGDNSETDSDKPVDNKYTFEFLSLKKSEKFENPYELNLCSEFAKGESGKTEEFKPPHQREVSGLLRPDPSGRVVFELPCP